MGPTPCRKAIINLLPTAPRLETDFEHSMHKTYTDCYHADGFVGGHWTYAINSNDTDAPLSESVGGHWINEKDRKIACYYLGWETMQVRLIEKRGPPVRTS